MPGWIPFLTRCLEYSLKSYYIVALLVHRFCFQRKLARKLVLRSFFANRAFDRGAKITLAIAANRVFWKKK